jgi:hypothetical protein
VTDSNGVITGTQKYFNFGSQQVAMQRNNEPVKYLFADQVGSTTLIMDSSMTSEIRDEARYKPFGDLCYQLASNGTSLPTDLLYTGQRADSYINLMWYDLVEGAIQGGGGSYSRFLNIIQILRLPW